MLSLLLSFGLPMVLSHLGVGAGLTAVLGAAGGKLATQEISGGAAKGIKSLLQHIHNGGEVSTQQRQWLQANSEALYLTPKQTAGSKDTGPDTWETPRTT